MSPYDGLTAPEFRSHPFCMRRGAEVQTNQGSCLSEPQASLHETPAGPSTAGCPQRSGGTQTVGSPFLGLLSFGEAKESESPAAATERHRNVPKNLVPDSSQRLRQAQPERGGDLASIPQPNPSIRRAHPVPSLSKRQDERGNGQSSDSTVRTKQPITIDEYKPPKPFFRTARGSDF